MVIFTLLADQREMVNIWWLMQAGTILILASIGRKVGRTAKILADKQSVRKINGL
ncbi:MAG: hypothetical protein AB1611_19070 [bacterium]